MIGLSTPTYDPNGAVVVPTRISNPYQGQRRGSVTATLDGGVSVYDGGYAVADQTLSATLKRPSKTLLQQLQYLTAYYAQVTVCCEVGAFSAILSFALNQSSVSLSFRLTGRRDT